MIPILFNWNETTFTGHGIGHLTEAISCTVGEARNGEYELEMEYPVSGSLFWELQQTRLILAKPNPVDEPQPFRIYQISKTLEGTVTVNARHISYDLLGIPVMPFQAKSVAEAFMYLESNSVGSNPFSFYTDKTQPDEYEFDMTTPTSAKSILAGSSTSIAGNWSGEFYFNKYEIKFLNERGTDRGLTLRYGREMTSLSLDEKSEDTYSGILGYYKLSDGIIEGSVQNMDSDCPVRRIKVVDVSTEIQNEGYSDDQVKADHTIIDQMAERYFAKNELGSYGADIDVSYVTIREENPEVETVGLCDTVTVIFEERGVNVKKKITKMEFDSLREEVTKLTIGEKETLSGTISRVSRPTTTYNAGDGSYSSDYYGGGSISGGGTGGLIGSSVAVFG